jgi:3-oxoacyl-[acyl-carrier-protein] synthase III
MSGVRLAGVGLLTGWGSGVAALPEDARTAAAGRTLISLEAPRLEGERFRRTTRECRLGLAAVNTLLAEAGLSREAIAGRGTGLVYVTAGGYGACNRAFIEASGLPGALHFPYTAPSAVPAEVTIEFGLTGRYVILIGGAATTIEALWQASRLVADGTCDRALVLAVETFAECVDLYRQARWLLGRPLVEAAACALLIPGRGRADVAPAEAPSALEQTASRRAGETLACAPLVALALARAAQEDEWRITGRWRRRRAALAVT